MEIPLGVRIVLVVVLVAAGLLLIAMARATATGRLGRNPYAGIRVASTLASDAAWRAAHERAQGPTIAAGVCSIAGGLIALVPLSAPLLATILIATAVVTLGLVILGARFGTQAARRVTDNPTG